MRILFTNNTLDQPAGTELSLRDAATRLKTRGHDVICFSRQHGPVADILSQSGIQTVGELGEIPVDWKPDVIHGHHEWETSLAALQFPESPIISFCRGVHAWQESPCTAPNVVKFVVVDTGCRDRLINEECIPESEIEMVLNGIDLSRFEERTEYRPKVELVLVFSNYARDDNYLDLIRRACAAEGVACEAIGNGVNRSVSNPTTFLQKADLVFAKGKAALEACASGAMVVVCDEPAVARDFVTPENFTTSRELSFGYPLMTEPHDIETYRNCIKGYNPAVAKAVCQLARDTADIERTVDQLESLYNQAVATWQERPAADLASFTQWASVFFEKKTGAYKLGRDSQEIWRNTDNPKNSNRYSPPSTPADETVEIHRIIDQLRKSHGLKNELKAALKKIKELESQSSNSKKKGWFQK